MGVQATKRRHVVKVDKKKSFTIIVFQTIKSVKPSLPKCHLRPQKYLNVLTATDLFMLQKKSLLVDTNGTKFVLNAVCAANFLTPLAVQNMKGSCFVKLVMDVSTDQKELGSEEELGPYPWILGLNSETLKVSPTNQSTLTTSSSNEL